MTNIAATDFAFTVVYDRVLASAPRRTDGGINQLGESGNMYREMFVDVVVTTSTNKDYPNDGIDVTTQLAAASPTIVINEKCLFVEVEGGVLKDAGAITALTPYFFIDRATKKFVLGAINAAAAGITTFSEAAMAAIVAGNTLTGRLKFTFRD